MLKISIEPTPNSDKQIIVDRDFLWLLGDALQGCIENDKTVYLDENDPRPDGKTCPGSGGWVTPRQIANSVLPSVKAVLGGDWEGEDQDRLMRLRKAIGGVK